jgi:hypothetical protein
MIEVGQCIRVQTKTLQDVFGVCYYEIMETGLQAPEKERKDQMDGIKCRMLGGSGPSAREGMVIHDSWYKMSGEIASGIIEIMSKEQAMKLLNATPRSNPQAPESGGNRPATGIVELD